MRGRWTWPFGRAQHGYVGVLPAPYEDVVRQKGGHATRHSGEEIVGWKDRVVPFVVANVAVVVLYLPWLANLVTRLRVDRSYWTGTLKLREALLDIALRFTSGETMSERMGLWLLIGYAGVTLVAAYGLWRLWPQTRRVVIYSSSGWQCPF